MKNIFENKKILIMNVIIVIILFINSTYFFTKLFNNSKVISKTTIIGRELIQSKKIRVEEAETIVAIIEDEENNNFNDKNIINNEDKTSSEENLELQNFDNLKQNEEKVDNIETRIGEYETLGKIEIPKTNVNLPIINHVTVDAMTLAPCLLYSTGELNISGNSYIVGHNYQDNSLFSNNDKLQIGDKINVTTLDNKKIQYIIYSKFVTTPEDIGYLQRNTENSIELTIQCCTDRGDKNIIILAKSKSSTIF